MPDVPPASPGPWFSQTPKDAPKERRQALAMIAAMVARQLFAAFVAAEFNVRFQARQLLAVVRRREMLAHHLDAASSPF